MKILMVASNDFELNEILNRVGFNDRLISYWFIRSAGSDFLHEYSTTGNYTRKDEGNGKAKRRGRRVVIDQSK